MLPLARPLRRRQGLRVRRRGPAACQASTRPLSLPAPGGPIVPVMRLARLLASLLQAAALSQAPTVAPPRELWVYCSFNLLVPANIDTLTQVMRRAANAGYTHVLLADGKFGRLGSLDERYFRHVARVKDLAAELRLELVPAVFPIGYSEAILWHDPNLAEALPVQDAKFVVRAGEARLVADPPVGLRGGDFADLAAWDWKDADVVADAGAARVTDSAGNARIVQKLRVARHRQYHVSVRVKTHDFRGTPEVKVLADGRSLQFAELGVQRTQDWTTHHAVWNSLEHETVTLYLGVWGGGRGSLWWDDAVVEEVGLLNVVRRDGAPLAVRRGKDVLVEGRDFDAVRDPRMGTVPWPGGYEVWHEPPALRTSLPDGTELRVDFHHAITVHQGQVTICPSEPKTLALLRDHMQRVHDLFGGKHYFLSHDEIRVLGQDRACRDRHLDAGALLAEHVRACTTIVREVAPGARISIWSDMFDPHHNAHADYYLVRGDLQGSWLGLDREVGIAAWYFDRRHDSLPFFAGRGHPLLLAAYYDGAPERVRDWLDASRTVGGARGVMYTTWLAKYDDLERFAELVRAWR